MKLHEVLMFELDYTTKELRKNSSMIDKKSTMDDFSKHLKIGNRMKTNLDKSGISKVLGQGVEAIVFQSGKPDQVGTARKWLRNQSREAKNHPFIQFLIKSQKINSTALPKVYNIKQYQYPNQKYDFMIEMEKLDTTIGMYIENNHDDPMLMYQFCSQFLKKSAIDNMEHDQLTGVNQVSSLFDKAIDGKYESELNPNFKKALDLVRSFINNRDIGEDLHYGNFMIRRTSVGPQLVITDPLTII